MDYPQVAGGGWERRLSDSTLPCCLMTLQNSTCEIPHPIWAPAILQDWWAPPSYITPTRQKLFFAFKNPPPSKTSLGHQKSGKEKSPNGRPCYHLSWYFREWLLILLASGQWIFRLYLFIRPSFSFSFSSRVQPSTGALTNRKTEPTDEFIMGESKNKNKKLKEELLAAHIQTGIKLSRGYAIIWMRVKRLPQRLSLLFFFVYQKRRFPFLFLFLPETPAPPPTQELLPPSLLSLFFYFWCVFLDRRK